jgi:hypothetical protein
MAVERRAPPVVGDLGEAQRVALPLHGGECCDEETPKEAGEIGDCRVFLGPVVCPLQPPSR